MLVHLHQYPAEDARTTVRDRGRPGTDESEYFDVGDLALDEWERVDRDGRVLQRRAVDRADVAAVPVPQDDGGGDLPWTALQLRTAGGDTEYVENAVLAEARDPDP